ncbi:MAG: hypothetical protein M3Y28_07365 [Armatimonadota bacterium]|nr:hypothetical protein [Armatimonadota bacterium]
MQKRQRILHHPRKAGDYEKYGRHWAVTDAAGQLVCLAVYKKGAQEVLRRLTVAAFTRLVPKRRTRTTRKQRQN